MSGSIAIIGRSGVIADVDTNTRALLVRPQPIDCGLLGSFRTLQSTGVFIGVMSAAIVMTMRWTSETAICVLREIRVSFIASSGLGIGKGKIEAFVRRDSTAADTGGTAVTVQRSGMKDSRRVSSLVAANEIRIATTGTLTAGGGTRDTAPFAGINFDMPNATANTPVPMTENSRIYSADADALECPVILQRNEGLDILATDSGSGSGGTVVVNVAWDERSYYP